VREFWRQKATSTEDPTTKRPVMAAPCKENKMAAKKRPLKERMTSLLLVLEIFLHFQEILRRKNLNTLPHR
jgi:hypothetical protein